MNKKITIEITPKGWTTKIQLGDKEFIETHKATPYGSTSEGELFEDNEEISEELWDAVNDISPYEAMKFLKNDNSN